MGLDGQLSDYLIWLLFLLVIVFTCYVKATPHLSEPWKKALSNRRGLISFCVLLLYAFIGLLDSIHFHTPIAPGSHSLLDALLSPVSRFEEKTYSKPLALQLANKETKITASGKIERFYPRLHYVPHNIKTASDRNADISKVIARSFLISLSGAVTLILFWMLYYFYKKPLTLKQSLVNVCSDIPRQFPRRTFLYCVFVMTFVLLSLKGLAQHYHILGTGKVGQDTFYAAVKSIRTGLIIGTVTTMLMLPFAIVLGTFAGFFKGWVDDVIQYVYTTLSSIPGVLLIAAAVLSMEIYINNHPEIFTSIGARADIRLLALCFILGITSWTSLCRLLRAETLKIREMDYVRAASALGVSQIRTISRHIVPNVMHLVLITVVLDFSSLVLAEAVLSYVGAGVDPTTQSWGNMINAARLEMARDPIVWWPLFSAFIFMFLLVLSANCFADVVRDIFDPRATLGVDG